MTSFEVCGFGVEGRTATLLVVMLLMWCSPLFSRWAGIVSITPWPWPTPAGAASATAGGNVPGTGSRGAAGGSEYLELHGASSISLRAPGTESLSRLGFDIARHARICFSAF